jgi:hypothetical protein
MKGCRILLALGLVAGLAACDDAEKPLMPRKGEYRGVKVEKLSDGQLKTLKKRLDQQNF